MSLSEWFDFHLAAKLGNEGYGSTYEYVAKFNLLKKWSAAYGLRGKISRLVIMGLPQKYGLSLDFLMWAKFLEVRRIYLWKNCSYGKVDRFLNACKAYCQLIGLGNLSIEVVEELQDVVIDENVFCVSCEVFQMLSDSARRGYMNACKRARCSAIFVPNFFNNDHRIYTKLATIENNDFNPYSEGVSILSSGYIDLPPVPSGFELPRKEESDYEKVKVTLADKVILFIISFWLNLAEAIIKVLSKQYYIKKAHLYWILINGVREK